MGKRLNDTDAIVHNPVMGSPNGNESVTIDIRKIDNGYVTRESRYGDNGYSSKETYSPSKPGAEKAGGSNMMRSAADYLNRK